MYYDFKQPKPANLKTQLFSLIEQQQTEQVIEFLAKHPEQAKAYTAQNHWTIGMYAVRYGNLRLIRYLHEHGLLTEHPQCTYSLVHAACFNNDIETLRLIIDELKRDPNSSIAYQLDNSPLKYAFKNDLLRSLEFLCSRGAYYQYESLTNNMLLIENKYRSCVDGAEVQPAQIFTVRANKPVQQNENQRDRTTPYLRYTRFRNLLFVKYLFSRKQMIDIPKLEPYRKIFEDNSNFNELLKLVAPAKQT